MAQTRPGPGEYNPMSSFLANQSHVGVPLVGGGGVQRGDVRGDANTLDNPGGVWVYACVCGVSVCAGTNCVQCAREYLRAVLQREMQCAREYLSAVLQLEMQ